MLTQEQIEKELNKKMVFKKEFTAHYSNENNEEKGAFEAFELAKEFCKKYGIDCGSMERSNPIGLAKNCDISKWTKLVGNGWNDRVLLEGVLVSESFRSGGKVILYYFENLGE